MFTCVLATTVILVPRPYGGHRRAGQLRGYKEFPFSGVTKFGRVWREVPESDARSVGTSMDMATSVSSKRAGTPVTRFGPAVRR